MDKLKLKDYLPFLKEQYPDIDEESLKKVIVKGMYKIYSYLLNGHEILIQNNTKYPERNYYMRIYEPMGIKKYNGRALDKAKRKQKLRNERKEKRAAHLSQGTADGQSDN